MDYMHYFRSAVADVRSEERYRVFVDSNAWQVAFLTRFGTAPMVRAMW